MATIIVKNTGGGAVDIPDLGISIPAAGQRTLVSPGGGEFTLDEVHASANLYTLVGATTLIINDGSDDLSTVNALNHIRLDTDWEIDGTFYNKTEMSTSGQSSVHWDNITNAPAFGEISDWLSPPAACRIEEISSAGPGGPVDGMYYLDSDDNHLYKRVTGSWVDQGSPSVDDRILNKDDEDYYDWTGTAWDSTTADEGQAIVVMDDGDDKGAQYILQSGDWVKIADLDWGEHGSLSGLGDDDHSQYHNDTRGDARYYQKTQHINTSAGAGDSGKPIVLDATGHIDESMINDNDVDHGGLAGLGDDDHTQYHTDARGDLRYFTQDQFEDTSQGTATPILADSTGKIDASFLPAVIGDTNVMIADFGRDKDKQKSQWLRTALNSVSNLTGPRVPKNITIVGMSVQCQSNANATFYVRKNGAAANLGNVVLSGVSGNHTYSLNISLTAGDFISLYMDVTAGEVDRPVVQIYYTWA